MEASTGSTLHADYEDYYPIYGWAKSIPKYQLNRDIWGTLFAPTSRNRIQRGIAAIAPWLKADSVVLDVGCGVGNFTSYLLETGLPQRSLLCIDISFRGLKLAREHSQNQGHSVEVIQADALMLPFVSESIDVVVCTEVLEHLKDDSQALHEISRVMRVGGIAYFTVPFERRTSAPWHVRCYDPISFRKSIHQPGLILKDSYLAGGLTSLIWALCKYPLWIAWLSLAGGLTRYLRTGAASSFYLSRFYQELILSFFNKISRIDQELPTFKGNSFGNTIIGVATKGKLSKD